MANLTVNTKKYGQITLSTKPHSDPLICLHEVQVQECTLHSVLQLSGWIDPHSFLHSFCFHCSFYRYSFLPQKTHQVTLSKKPVGTHKQRTLTRDNSSTQTFVKNVADRHICVRSVFFTSQYYGISSPFLTRKSDCSSHRFNTSFCKFAG